MSSIDSIDDFKPGQKKLNSEDFNLMKSFLRVIRNGLNGVAPIRVSQSEMTGFQISIDDLETRFDFSLQKTENVKEDGVVLPDFLGNGIDADNNYTGKSPDTDYIGSRWTFFNKGQGSDGVNDSIISTIDTSQPFIAEISATALSGDWVGARSGFSLLQLGYPGFKVLADTSGLTGGTTALIVRRPIDGMLGKASVAILEGSSGNVKLSDVSGITQGNDFLATNKGSDVSAGDFLQFGEDANGNVFFKQTKSGGGGTLPTPTQWLKIMEYATGYFFHTSGSVYSDMEAMWRIYHPYLYYTGPSMGVTEWFSSNAGAIFEDASWRVTTPFGISGFTLIGSGASDGTYTWFVDSTIAQIAPPADNLPPGW